MSYTSSAVLFPSYKWSSLADRRKETYAEVLVLIRNSKGNELPTEQIPAEHLHA